MSKINFNVDHLFHGRAVGWIVDDARHGPAEIKLYFDDKYGCSVFASLTRPDVMAYNGVLLCGFDINISDDLMKRHETLSLRASNGMVIAEFPKLTDAIGYASLSCSIDVANFAEIKGWCVNPDRPEKAVSVSVYCAGDCLFTTLCNQNRPDVLEYLNITSNINPGFSINPQYHKSPEKDFYVTFDNNYIVKCDVFSSSFINVGNGQKGIILPFNIDDILSIHTDDENMEITILPSKILLEQTYGSVLVFSHIRGVASAILEVKGQRKFEVVMKRLDHDYEFALHIVGYL